MSTPFALKKNTTTFVKPKTLKKVKVRNLDITTTLDKFNNTPEFFDWISKHLKLGGHAKIIGDAFENFTNEWHMQHGDYIAVYNTNNIDNIPPSILHKTNVSVILDKGGDSFGIDKICLTRSGEIDIMQDKSTLHLEKNLSTDKAAKMMSVRDNPLTNIRDFIINTTAQDLSHYKDVWKNQTPIAFGYNDFITDDIDQDIEFWNNIRRRKQNVKLKILGTFVPRGPQQEDWVNNNTNYLEQQLLNSGYAKGWANGVGSLGKSVMDPVILANLEKHFNKAYTGTPAPVSVSFYHSSKTLPKNGWEEVSRRRAIGLYDKVIILSGTSVIDGEADTNNNKFTKLNNVADAVVEIQLALEKKQSVLILTLYHHAESVAKVKTQLSKKYSGFKFWYRKRDECDWPCSNSKSSYAPALDDRTESVITFGSSGTSREGGKSTVEHYGTNNLSIHGPLIWNYAWGQAEADKGVKPLILLTPSIYESEIAKLFPEFVTKEGRVDWTLKVSGIPVDNTYPTVENIVLLVCFIKTLAEYPEIQRTLGFAHRRKTNKLIEVNYPWVVDRLFDKRTSTNKRLKKLFIQTMNDDFDNEKLQDHTLAIKEAKAHNNYLIGSSKLFSRGYDDIYSPKHHAGIHWDAKGPVDSAQEIWRFTRLDEFVDNAYYILPLIYNDLDDVPTWSENRLQLLQTVLENHDPIREEFEIKLNNPGKHARKPGGGNQWWTPEDIEGLDKLGNLINVVAQRSKGKYYTSLAIEAHNWLLKEKLKLSNPFHGGVYDKFLLEEKFKPLSTAYPETYKKDPRTFVESFWAGSKTLGASKDLVDTIDTNLIEFKLHKKKYQQKKKLLGKLISNRAEELTPHLLWPDSNYTAILYEILEKEFSNEKIPHHQLKKYANAGRKVWWDNHAHYVNQIQKIYDIVIETMPKVNSNAEIWETVLNRIDETGIILPDNRKTPGTIMHLFSKKTNNKKQLFTEEQMKLYEKLKSEVTGRATSAAQIAMHKDPVKKAELMKKIKQNQKAGKYKHSTDRKRAIVSKLHGRFDGIGDLAKAVGCGFMDKHRNLPHLYWFEDEPFTGEPPTEKVYYLGKYGYSRDFKPIFEKALKEGCPYAKQADEKYKDGSNRLVWFRKEVFGKVTGYEQREDVKRDWLFETDELAIMPTAFKRNKKFI